MGSKKDEVVCKCKHVRRSDVRKAVEAGARTYKEVRAATGAGSKCGHCKGKVKSCLEDCLKELEAEQSAPEKAEAVLAEKPAESAAPVRPVGATEPSGERQVQLHRVYRHFKGDYYLVEDVATHSETGEKCVVYRKLYGDGSLWVRPLDMFLSEVDAKKHPDAKQRYRFELMDIASAKE